jgi:hypothetical protein
MCDVIHMMVRMHREQYLSEEHSKRYICPDEQLPPNMPTMPTTVKFKDLIGYTVLAATTARNIAERAQVPFLGLTTTLCLSITKSIEVSPFLCPLVPCLTKEIDNQIKQRNIC